ncbi:hypothetical protein NHH03_07080 [Stieleria sp. TO1_6]|uniref:hypothetical protein n=1 Tax=Stieleria tagensis TaxID=2956795 RepID=UPI00209BA1F1|nr:hypothetical protein [Stieleria tagensis]MCO8121494.1 hypothetical protein [Stieleria tagensis]
MNNRIVTLVMAAALVTTTTGCGPIRNFLFGQGAQCGLCNRVAAPFQPLAPSAVPAGPRCNTPTYLQPRFAPQQQRCAPERCAPERYGPAPYAQGPSQGSCGCNQSPCQTPNQCNSCGNGSGYGPSGETVINGYGYDPYSSDVIGNGVVSDTVIEGQPIYSDTWMPAPLDSSGVRANYPNYEQGYKLDDQGDRIIQEDPLPPGAFGVN